MKLALILLLVGLAVVAANNGQKPKRETGNKGQHGLVAGEHKPKREIPPNSMLEGHERPKRDTKKPKRETEEKKQQSLTGDQSRPKREEGGEKKPAEIENDNKERHKRNGKPVKALEGSEKPKREAVEKKQQSFTGDQARPKREESGDRKPSSITGEGSHKPKREAGTKKQESLTEEQARPKREETGEKKNPAGLVNDEKRPKRDEKHIKTLEGSQKPKREAVEKKQQSFTGEQSRPKREETGEHKLSSITGEGSHKPKREAGEKKQQSFTGEQSRPKRDEKDQKNLTGEQHKPKRDTDKPRHARDISI